ncbi:hypothetical protein Syun_022386 [Stephania yunnanensis]|uniref:Integrase catalytic domain-containing protein n=1 Tax=Stephania yunnanensis TaxID=152371 RepID=A0AAP0F6W3_9MAGN
MTFIDDCSRMIWVYTLKNKSDAFSCFQKFKAIVEKQSGRYIKTLRTGGGGEYTSSTFSKFCDRHGIKHEIMPPQTTQQNGVAERKNKTIIDMAHKEAWSGYKPSVKHLKVFGSTAYVHVLDANMKKLDDKGVKVIFIGYIPGRIGTYKLYNPVTNAVIVSKDVKFDENNPSVPVAEHKEIRAIQCSIEIKITNEFLENLEKVIGTDDSTFSGIDLATLIRNKYGRSYDVQLIKKEFMGRNLLAMNVMWKYREQKSFPLTEEEYLLRLDGVANTLKCWGAVSHIRNSLAKLKERPRIGKAVSIFIDMDESGGRAREWIYK